MTLLVSAGAFAQNGGLSGINQATSMVTSYFLVEQFLLPLAVLSVLLRDFFLVPYLHVKDSREQVGPVACCHCCRCLHDCMF